jgi:hypothetical protein
MTTPEKIIQQQVEAYNARDINRFAACHALDIELYNHPETKPFCTGRENLIKIYSDVFKNSPELHTEILNRMVMDNVVIDHERVTGRKGVNSLIIIAIYEIEDGLISKARFIRSK